MVSEPVLRVEKLVKTFGAFRALDEFSFEVHAGEILGLVGPNGSGKTTSINVVSGLYPPNGGTVRLGGKSIGGLKSHKIVHLGVNRTFQIPKPFMQLTARENVEVARTYGSHVRETVPAERLLADLNLDKLARPSGDRTQQRAAENARSRARSRHRPPPSPCRRTRGGHESGRTRLDRGQASPSGALGHGDRRRRASDGLHRTSDRPRRSCSTPAAKFLEASLRRPFRIARVVEVFLGAPHGERPCRLTPRRS